LGTSIASILFYQLIKQAGSVFASMVTYGIPLVAIFWGKCFGEAVGRLQILGLLVILSGVYLANAKSSRIKS
jgi:drug/metabolite transporter (DMT)-like permease